MQLFTTVKTPSTFQILRSFELLDSTSVKIVPDTSCPRVMGLHGEVLVAGGGGGGAIGVASVRSCEMLSPCLIRPVLPGSVMDPLLAKAKPISDGDTPL